MRGTIPAIVFGLAAAPAMAAAPATLTVTVDGVGPGGGTLRVGLYDEASFPQNDNAPVKGTVVPAKSGEMVVTLRGVPPGDYAVKVLQDMNGNTKADAGEPFGVTGDLCFRKGGNHKVDGTPQDCAPPFDRAAITLHPGGNAVTVHLH